MRKAKANLFFTSYTVLVYGLFFLLPLLGRLFDYLSLDPQEDRIAFLLSHGFLGFVKMIILFWPGMLDLGLFFQKISKKEYTLYLLLQWLPLPLLYLPFKLGILPPSRLDFWSYLFTLLAGNLLALCCYLFLRMTEKTSLKD